MTKNTILAVVLSVGFLFLWTKYYRATAPTTEQVPPTAAADAAAGQNAGLKTERTADAAATRAKRGDPSADAADVKTLVFENDAVRAVFSSEGGAIISYQLKYGKDEVDIVAPGAALMATLPGQRARLYKKRVRGADAVVSEQKTETGALVRKTFTFDGGGLAGLDIEASGEVPRVPLILSSGIGDDRADAKEIASGNAVKYLAGKTPTRVKSGGAELKGAAWLAADSRYFIVAIMSTDGAFSSETLEVTPKTRAAAPVAIMSTAAGAKYRVVAGGKSYTRLGAMNLGLEKTLDFGFMGGLGKFFLRALIAINTVTKNYGWAIVILSLCIQAVTLPLSLKSLKATADMKRLQPLMREIQKKFKDDPKRMNVEVMNLYKTHRVNPLSGCLPMLLQMPIFWALFTTLRNAYELRGAGWILWIKDLSAADPFYVLPVLMGAGMFAQQFMSGATQDPQNKMMGYVFPAVFTFMFLKFPSGVVLYWLINSLMTITIQLFFLEKEIIKEHREAVVVKHPVE